MRKKDDYLNRQVINYIVNQIYDIRDLNGYDQLDRDQLSTLVEAYSVKD